MAASEDNFLLETFLNGWNIRNIIYLYIEFLYNYILYIYIIYIYMYWNIHLTLMILNWLDFDLEYIKIINIYKKITIYEWISLDRALVEEYRQINYLQEY